jgi:hypothetical protein
MKNDNSSFERVEEFKYLGKTWTNQNSIQEEIKKRGAELNIWAYGGRGDSEVEKTNEEVNDL